MGVPSSTSADSASTAAASSSSLPSSSSLLANGEPVFKCRIAELSASASAAADAAASSALYCSRAQPPEAMHNHSQSKSSAGQLASSRCRDGDDQRV
jgi:hypothetical protein